MTSEGKGAILCSVDEVLVYSLAQDISPLIGEVEHVAPNSLPPLLPFMFLDMSVMFLPIYVPVLPGDYSRAVFVHAHVKFHSILNIDSLNPTIYPIYFFFLIGIVCWFWAIICEPSKLGGIEEGTYGDCVGVGTVVVVFQLTNILAKLFDYFSDKFSTMAL